jgi:glucose 1-dehydrogenase
MATFGFHGRVALVTGGAQGMGREIAERFGREGASVVVGDVSEEGGNETVANIVAAGGKAVFRRTDVSKAADVNAVVKLALDTYGDLHHAVNAAAIEGEPSNLLELEEDNFERIIDVNLKSVYLLMRAQIRAFLDSGHGGTIVNICSTNSFRPQPGQSAYTASKHGVVGLTKTAAIEFADKGIRVNGIAPGSIDTPMLRNAIQRRAGGDPSGSLGRLSIIGRFGTVQEIASAAMWLSCDESTYTFGHILGVDGAYLSR